jgi:hypothetical protein
MKGHLALKLKKEKKEKKEEKWGGVRLCLFRFKKSRGKKKKKKKRVRVPLSFQLEKLWSTKIQLSDLQSVFENVIFVLGSMFLPIV